MERGPKRNGGWRQALREEAEADRSRSRSPDFSRAKTILSTRPEHCQLALDLILDWAWGITQAPTIQRYSHSAVQGGCRHPILMRLSKLGGSGSSPQNINAQLLRLFRQKLRWQSFVEPLEGDVTCMAPPHKVFQGIFSINPLRCKSTFGLNRMKLKLFWTDFFATEEGADMRQRHPHLVGRSPEDLETTFPMNCHCDAGPFTKKLTAHVCSWSSLFSVGSELEIRFIIATWIKGLDDRAVWARLWLSFCFLARGSMRMANF